MKILAYCLALAGAFFVGLHFPFPQDHYSSWVKTGLGLFVVASGLIPLLATTRKGPE